MAHMYPYPIRPETESMAERKVYTACARQLPPEWRVFHGARWLVRDRRGGARDGETDFVIAAPERGLIVLEVKGGNIYYDGDRGTWSSNNQPIKDPFRQAHDGMRNLMGKMNEMPVWHSRPLPYICRAVAFPDVVVDGDVLPDAPREIILDIRDLRHLEAWCMRVFDYFEARIAMNAAEIDALVDLLAPSRTLDAGLVDQMEQERERIIELTEDQYSLLGFLRHQRRVAVSGCAGSGKTMLAMEQARRLARQGYDVLLTCFNRCLAEHMQDALAEHRSVTVMHFHGLCQQMVTRAGLDVQPRDDIPADRWFRERLPELLLDAADSLGSQYDAILVDEGQDFCANYWEPLMLLLHDADEGIFYVFYDDNQNLYVSGARLPEGLSPFALNENLRNTMCIHNCFIPFYSSEGGTLPRSRGPHGRPVETYCYSSYRGLQNILRRVLHHLTIEERVPLSDIAVLTPYRNRGLLHDLPRLGNAQLVDSLAPGPGQVCCCTIHSFKGLEKPVVILAHLEPSEHQDVETLFYVGASRAKYHLVILASDELPEEFRERLPASTDGSYQA